MLASRFRAPSFGAAGLLSALILVAALGCITGPQNPAATQPATVVDPATTQPSYWYAQPPPGFAVYDSFATLFKTCENVSRDFGFKIDRVDYRTGILTTEPLISAQIFEPWRPDVQEIDASQGATLASIRRTVRYEFSRKEDGTYEVGPKVLIERQTVQERRITNVALYRGAYQREDPKDRPKGTKESDAGFNIPGRYWYAIGRDPALERALAKEVSARLAKKGREPTVQTPTTAPIE